MRKLLFLMGLIFIKSVSAQFGIEHNALNNFAYGVDDKVAIDFDNDGDLDIPASMGYYGDLGINENLGDGNFISRELAQFPQLSPYSFMINRTLFVKVNDDDLYDIVIDKLSDDNEVYVIYQTAPMQLSEPVLLAGFDQTFLRVVDVMDIDDDGSLEWLIQNIQDLVFVFHLNGTLVYEGVYLYGPLELEDFSVSNRVVDMDIDGDKDVIREPIISYDIQTSVIETITLQWNEKFVLGYLNTSIPTIDVSSYNFSGTMTVDWRMTDVDVDGDIDVLMSYGTHLFYMSNLGSLNFEVITLPEASEDILDILVADFDNNGFEDILTVGVSSNTELFLSDGAGNYNAVNVDGEFPALAVYFEPADLNSDGWADLFSSNQEFVSSLGLMFNEGANSFAPIRILDMGVGGIFPGVLANGEYEESSLIMVSYLDYYDVSTTGFLKVDYNKFTGLSTKTYIASIPGIFNQYQPRMLDIDSDNDLDVVFQTTTNGFTFQEWWLPQNSDGSFGEKIALPYTDYSWFPLASWDVNQDGLFDFLVLNDMGNLYEWYVNDGTNNFNLFEYFTLGGDQLFVEWIDFNNDGMPDCHFIDNNTNAHYISINNNGIFESLLIEFPECGVSFREDFDGNGILDGVVFNCGPSPALCFYSSDGSYTILEANYLNEIFQSSVLADLNEDGTLDILIQGEDSNILFFANDGNSVFLDGLEMCLPDFMDCTLGELHDLDGDGDLDNLLSNGVWHENLAISQFKITGTCFLDQDADGIWDVEEIAMPYQLIESNPGIPFSYTNSNGDFNLYPATIGEYELSTTAPEYYELTTPNPVFLTITDEAPISSGWLFGVSPELDTLVFNTNYSTSQALCDQTLQQWYHLDNSGTAGFSAFITLTWDSSYVAFNEMSVADSLWDYSAFFSSDQLNPFEELNLSWYLQSPSFLQMGDTLKSFVRTDIFDENGLLFSSVTDTICQVLLCAYDPNDKQVSTQGWTDEGFILNNESLEYTVRFQNTGNYFATDVRIEDQLSENLDWSSMEFVASSHNLTNMYVEGSGMAHFEFDNIMLPDSSANFEESNGFVKYRINLLPGLEPLSTIENTANIYFDQNPPVITNTTLNTIFDCELMQYNILMEAMVCEGDIFEYYPEVQYAETYQWYVDGVFYSNESEIAFPAMVEGVYEIQLLASNDLCQIEVNIPLGVSTTPVAPLLIQDGNAVVSDQSGGIIWFFNDELQNGVFGDVFAPIEDGWVSAIVFNGECPSLMSEPVYFDYVYINEDEKNSILLNPNPAETYVTLTLPSNMDASNYAIYDSMGRKILAGYLMERYTVIELSELPSGLYEIVLEDLKRSIKLVIE
jgi:uncharacterized repeat protein (TIGR01451 family)